MCDNHEITLEDFKSELRWQLTFENIDWEYFKRVVEMAIIKDTHHEN